MSSTLRRLLALMKKETLQVRRDPSCILIAFVLPMILLFIFGYGLSLDAKYVKVGFVTDEQSPVVGSLWRALTATDYITPIYYDNRHEAEEALVNGHIRGLLVLQNNFTERFHRLGGGNIQLITDGVETNTATILENYIIGIVNQWGMQQVRDGGILMPIRVDVQIRVLFNPELVSRNVLIPSSIVMIMAIIGTLLTSLVVAREWERGTMEAMLATPIGTKEMILGKLIPYYGLGILSTGICILISVNLFQVPLRGSIGAIFLISTVFLISSLALGFLISTVTKNQYLASNLALVLAFLPNVMLSGAIFEINSMPLPIRIISRFFPARYYVTCLQTIFMAGDIWSLILPNLAFMALIALFFLIMAIAKTSRQLE